jgi:hypothetical protein
LGVLLWVQIMWMTTGMAPMMFPGAHQLMPPMAMGLSTGCMPAAQSLSQLQRVAPFMNNPLPNQVPQVQSSATNSLNVTNQMQNNGICAPRNPFLHPNETIAAEAQVIGTHFISVDLSDICSWWLISSSCRCRVCSLMDLNLCNTMKLMRYWLALLLQLQELVRRVPLNRVGT